MERPTRPNLPTDVARLPIPGNAEIAVLIIVVIIVWLVCWIADDLGAPNWVDFVKWTVSAYLISRGIAKASRVLEQ
ncbi:MAG TPA: hypothetical protein VF232_07130 [Gaiellaceae bacterium]|jgi:uncharacterized protein (DUF983 family)